MKSTGGTQADLQKTPAPDRESPPQRPYGRPWEAYSERERLKW